ncbi:MAG: MFS transporter, partial [Spirulinaceae cyanobacterium]
MLSDRKIMGQENLRLPLVLLAGSLITMAGGVLAPILPELAQQLNLNPILVGNLVSIHCLTLALFCLPLGILTDQLTPSKVLIPSLALYSIFGCAGAFMTDFWPLLATRALLGAASGGIAAGSLGWLGQEYEGEARSQAIGYATATLTIAGIICPLLGGWLGSWNWRWAFCLYGVGLPLAFLTAWIIAPSESRSHSKAHAVPDLGESFTKLLRHRAFWRLLVGLGLASIVMYAVFIYLPLY